MAAWHDPGRERLAVTLLSMLFVLAAFGLGALVLWRLLAPVISALTP